MTDVLVTDTIGDAWTNGQTTPKDRTGTNYGDTNFVQLLASERRGFLWPPLGSIRGRTVVDAYLVGHAGPGGVAAQTVTVAATDKRVNPGRINSANRPGGIIGAGVATTIAAAAAGAAVEFTGLSPIFQAVADGTEFLGLRLTTSAVTEQLFYATDSGLPAWELHLTLSDVTDAPDNLRPDNGAVGTVRPVLAWDCPDMVQFQLQMDDPALGIDPDEVAPDFNPGWVVSTDPSFDVAASVHTPAGTDPHAWRVRAYVEGAQDPTPWSDWAYYTVSTAPVLVVDSPIGSFGDITPLITAHLSTGTLESWRVMVTGKSRADVRFDTGLSTGPISVAVPEKHERRKVIVDGGWIYFKARDVEDRAISVGGKDYVDLWLPIVLADGAALAAPTNLTVTQVAKGDPRHVWSFLSPIARDSWLFSVDDVTETRVAAVDVPSSGGRYTWADHGEVGPLRPHELRVRGVEGKDRTAPAMVTKIDGYDMRAVWLLPTDDIDPIVLNGVAVGGFSHNGRRATYEPLVGPSVDIIYDANPGMAGSFEGSVDSRDSDLWGTLDRVDALRNSASQTARMVWGSRSILVQVIDIHHTPAEDILRTNLNHVVRFLFRQVDD